MNPGSGTRRLLPDNVALHYTGFFSAHNITAMGEVIKAFLENQQAPVSVRRRLFSSFVEIVQNILRYSQDSRAMIHADQDFRFGTVTLHMEGDNYVLESSNQVDEAACEQLRHWLDVLRTMSNEEYGHPMGDRVICGLVSRIQAHCPDAASIGRIGGEEFTVLLPHYRLSDAVIVAGAIHASLNASPLAVLPGQLVTASLGVSYGKPGSDFETLYNNADAALYDAKHHGRNRVFFR